MHEAFLKASSSQAKYVSESKSRTGENVGKFSAEQSCPEFEKEVERLY